MRPSGRPPLVVAKRRGTPPKPRSRRLTRCCGSATRGWNQRPAGSRPRSAHGFHWRKEATVAEQASEGMAEALDRLAHTCMESPGDDYAIEGEKNAILAAFAALVEENKRLKEAAHDLLSAQSPCEKHGHELRAVP